ncbi:MAG: type II toxin-antitoxin system Phd/YefM family antitoxin [Arcobacteraceae bacterium]
MYLSQDIKPISYLKSKTADVINSVNDNQRTIIITQNGEAKAVVQDIKSYENLQNSLNLLKLIVQGENDIENNNTSEQEEMFKTLEQKLFGSCEAKRSL